MAPVGGQAQPPSIIGRVDRLDLMLGHLEAMRSGRGTGASSPACSGPLAASTAGEDSSAVSSPGSLSRRRCRPVEEAVAEARVKGGLVDRIDLLESRVLKMEEDMEIGSEKSTSVEKKPHKKGLKQLVKSCVRGDLKTKE